jgi:immune inhibitor A
MTTQTITKPKTRQQSIPGSRERVYHKQPHRRSIPQRPPRISLILVSLLLGMTLGFIWVADLNAMPASPQLKQAIGEGRIALPYFLQHESSLKAMGIDSPEPIPPVTGVNGLAKAALVGNQNILTIIVDFSDKTSQVNPYEFDTLIYVNRTGTVVNYYLEVSYNQLTITAADMPSTLGWQRAPQTYSYYVNNQNGFGSYPQNAQKLVEDIVDQINPLVDFSQYDNDGDGFVDGLIVLHSGPGAEYTGLDADIWSHQWGINPRLKDGVYISTYSMEPEYWASPGDMTCGVFCHELGHVFGLGDLYDTDYTSDGVGKWSLMAAGSWNGTLGSSPAHLDAYSRIALGFASSSQLVFNLSQASLPAVESNQMIYRVWTNGDLGDEYFLVENRQKTGYDTYLPAGGLLLWHVDLGMSDNDNEWWPGSGYPRHYQVALVQADGLWGLEHGTSNGDAGDPFPGIANVRQINGSGALNTNSYAGAATSVALTNISNSGNDMTVDISVGVAQGINDDLAAVPNQIDIQQNYPNPFNSQTDIRFELRESANLDLSVFNITGAKIKQLYTGDLSTGIHHILWDGRDDSGKKVGSGAYFYRLNINGKSICKKMLLLK